MKNLFAIPRLSLPETFTILITLVVCLVGFTNAEVYSNHRKRNPNQREKENFLLQKSSFRESVPYSHEKSKISNELGQKKFASLRYLPDSPLEKLFKTNSDYFGESEDADSEKESDGYGYDEDEYYHFNSKRNDDLHESSIKKENIKSEKDEAGKGNAKEALKNAKLFHNSHKETDKETETIEMLNFKECHTGGKSTNTKPLSDELHKKQFGADAGSSLKMSDLRENSAIDEKIKERKESGGGLAANEKLVEGKDELKSDDKDSAKLKDVKLTEDPEKREKDPTLKDAKEAVAPKSLKEDSNASEGKEKNVKLNENDKLEENLNKVESKSKEPAKIVKGEEDVSNYSDKLNEDELSEINSRANFMSNDYNENAEALRTAGADEEEKNSYEMGGVDKSNDQDDCQEVKSSRDRMRKQDKVRESYADEGLKAFSHDAKQSEAFRDEDSFLLTSSDYDTSNLNPKDIFKKSQFWREGGLRDAKSRHQQNTLQQKTESDQNSQEQQDATVQMMPAEQSQNQQTQNSIFDSVMKNPFGLNLPQLDVENGEVRKGYTKSFKRLKDFGEKSKTLLPESSNSLVRNNHDRLEAFIKEPRETKNRRSTASSVTSEGKGKIHNKYSNTKRNAQDDLGIESKKCQVQPPEFEQEDSSIKSSKSGSKLSDGQNQDEQQNNRLRRKSPQKFEYEIKVINQSKDDTRRMDQLSHCASRRVEKDLKSKVAADDKHSKKHPYSQASREDLMTLNKITESENYRKIKRRAPLVKRHNSKSNVQPRAVPSGYYGNRVKFGQKSLTRNNEGINAEHTLFEGNDAVFPYFNVVDKSRGQTSKEIKDDDFKHDPMKRFDESGTLNKGNSLLLIKKDEHTGKTFEEGSAPTPIESDYNSDVLARILAKDSDFLVLKKTEKNKFQKVSENPNTPNNRADSSNNQFVKDTFFGENDDQKNSAKQAFLKKGLQTRSFRFEKDDKKYATNMHGTSSKSNLKKTFDKFRDLAGFFKDNEQEPPDNSVREAKEGRDIVFSEDKLPDPIVISSDPGEKYSALKAKPPNPIYSISTNFKALDQQEKKNELHNFDNRNNFLSSSGKADTAEYSWQPALRNVFPEAKSINATIRNGNEIIVLDLNRNQLRREHLMHAPIKQGNKQPYAPFGSTAQLPMSPPQFPPNIQFQFPMPGQFPVSSQFPNNQLGLPNGSRKIQMVLENGNFMQQETPNSRSSDKSNKAHDRKAYTVFTTEDNGAKIILPSSDASNFSSLIKNIFDKKDSYKAVAKKSLEGSPENKITEHYNKFLKDLGELSEVKEKENKRQGFFYRRNPNAANLAFNTIKQLPRDDDTLKYLGNLLQSIITNADPHLKGDKDENFNQGSLRHMEDSGSGSSKEGPNGIARHWSPGDEKSGEVSSVAVHKDEYAPKEEDSAGLRSEMSIPTKEKNSEDELWEELAAASDKIHRLRREGKEKRKRKASAVSRREKHQSALQNALPGWKPEEGGQSGSDSKQSEGAREKNGNGLNWVDKLKDEEVSKGSSDVKTRFETHLKELIEDLNDNKNQKEELFVPNESAWSRKKRKDTRRRKRSTWSDVKKKVSTTAVQNTILKNLAEDNYHSVYSPGIKRRLLSTDIEAEDADSYSDENERDKNVIAEEPQAKCVKNSLNECVDPMIIELLKDGAEEEKDRERRSLTSDFHSDFKREIDLDESMPNDFQNFLVTSLGAFGSQKREVVKKDEAAGEGKESSPDNYNRAAEGGKEATEDSALEKREVPYDDSQLSSYKESESFADLNLAPSMKMESAVRGEDRSSLKSKTPELTDEKLPTQIRIQITNANGKEKKPLKPALEESETTSMEMENLSNEKEFLDKGKPNSLRKNNLSKFRHLSLSRLNFNELDDGDYQDSGVKQVPYHSSKRRQKKKKFGPDTPLNPANDLTKLDQKAVESFPRRIVAETSLTADHTTQKSAVSNHLPQVETVYNPTQGTNKAQLQSAKLTKTNSISNKNSENARTNLGTPERSRFEKGILRSYLKEKAENFKSEKLKDFQDWKSPNPTLGLKQKVEFDIKNVNGENPPRSDTTPVFTSQKHRLYFQKHNPAPLNNYFFHAFPKETVSPNNLYDVLKLKQEMKNRNVANRDRQNAKIFQKTHHMSNQINHEDRLKSQNSPTAIGNMNAFDFTVNKKFSQEHNSGNSGEYLFPTAQSQSRGNSKSKMTLSKKYEADEKYPLLDASRDLTTDGSKEQDYLDSLEEDYGEEGQLASDEKGANVLKETNKILRTPGYSDMFGYKFPDIDDGIGEDDDEADEDYDENADDELDDYSLLTQKAVDPPDGEGGSQANPLSAFSFPNQKDNLQEVEAKFASPNAKAKFSSKSQLKHIAGRDSGSFDLCRSSSLLKKINENGNIFGKNLMQNLYGLGYDDSLPGSDKTQKQEMERVHEYSTRGNKLSKGKLDSERKVKRSRKPGEVDRRVFSEVQSEVSDSDVLSPPSPLKKLKPLRSIRSNNYRLTQEHFLDAEFAGPGNDYENESEEKGKYFNQVHFAKNGFSQKVSNERNIDETEDVKENPEDHGETISDDNILENVIGKYIMRKTVKASPDQASKRSANKEKIRENRSLWHKRRKRSAGYPERVPKAKVVRKRLSSGHLTENNFRKYHKKNLTRKRHVPGLRSAPQSPGFLDQGLFKSEIEKGRDIQAKRSALDLLKKLTNKERDKKAETPIDSRTAGFEPLSPFKDEKLQGSANPKESTVNQDSKLTGTLANAQPKNSLAEAKLPLMRAGYISKDSSLDKKKSKVTLKEGSGQRVQGPWKVELNDKCDPQASEQPLKDSGKGFNKLVDLQRPEEPKSLKTFLVIGKSPKLVKIEEPLHPASGSDLKEVGSSSYRFNFEEGRGISNKYFRKRYLKSSVDRMRSDYGGAEKTSSELAEKAQKDDAEETNRALHELNSFAEGGPSQPTQRLQRNSKKSFVNADDQSKTSRLFSKGRLVKRKSAFPPSKDAKIIRDSRHVNEETSEYLGQQVVNAILSHVSANPRFKELIAPGLAPRTPTYKQENYDKDSTLQQADVSNQLQYFLQKFMYDLEKLAERRVKKRTCTQIDKQAKEFLEFLLSAPTDSEKSKAVKEDICPIPGVLSTISEDQNEQMNTHFYNVPTPECTTEARAKTQSPTDNVAHTTKGPMPEYPSDYAQECTTEYRTRPQTTTECPPEFGAEHRTKAPTLTEPSYKDLKTEIDALRKKCCLLLKLIVDYQNLSKLEKDVLDSKYHSIMMQLDRINKEIKSAKNMPEGYPETHTMSNEDFLCCGYKLGKNQQSKNMTHETPSNCFQTTESTRCSTNGRVKPKQSQTKKLPKLYFEEMKNPAEPEVSTTTCIPIFEKVSVGKISELRKDSKGKPQTAFEVAPPTTLAPNSFDLLLYSNASRAHDYSKHSNTTCEPSIRLPTRKPTPCPQALAPGDSQPMIINSISTVNSGSNLHPISAGQQEARKGRKKFAPHLPRRRKKRSIRKIESEFRKLEGSRKRPEGNDEEEYNGWSSVSAARRILNSLESGFEYDDLLFQKPKITKKWRRREKKPD